MCRLSELGAIHRQLLLTCTFKCQVILLLRALGHGFRPLQIGLGLVAQPFANQLAWRYRFSCASVVDLFLRKIGLGVGQCLLGNLLLAAAEFPASPRSSCVRWTCTAAFVHGQLLTVVGGIELGEHGPGLYPLAFLDRQVHDATRDFKAHQTLVRLDVAGEVQKVRLRLSAIQRGRK